MKKAHKKITLITSGLLTLLSIPTASITLVKSINSYETNIYKSALSLNDIVTKDFDIVLNIDYSSLDWYGTDFADSVTEAHLKQVLVSSAEFDANYGMEILIPQGNDLNEGYVNFAVYKINSASGTYTDNQDARTYIEPPSNINFSDDSSSNIDMREYSSPTTDTVDINGVSLEQKYIWTTKNISGLFLPKKYRFSWNTNEQIASFLEETTLSPSSLSEYDVYANMFTLSDITNLLPDDTEDNINSIVTISTSDSDLSTYGINATDATRYGVALITVNFSNSSEGTDSSKWVDSYIPTNETYLVRGLNGSYGKNTMHLNTDDSTANFISTTLNVSTIKSANPNVNLSGSTIKIGDLTPTQLINLLANDSTYDGFKELITTQTYLSSNSSTPALYLTYMGSNSFNANVSNTNTTDSSESWKGTGLEQIGKVATLSNGIVDTNATASAAYESKISQVTPIADDENGILTLKVTYDAYNVYYNAVEKNITTAVTISGLQTSTLDTSNSYYVQWKTVDELLYSDPNQIIDLYNANINDADYLKSLSNSFLIATSVTYELDRDVTLSLTGNNLYVSLTFSEFSTIPLTIANTYVFSSSSSISITFKSQSEVASAITNYSDYTPTELINAINDGSISLSTFYTPVNSSYYTIITQNGTADGIVITVTDGNGKYATGFYNGLTKGISSDYVYNYSLYDGLTQGITYLKTNINFDDITVNDIYEYYVSKLAIFNGNSALEISLNDISIYKDSANQTITVTINNMTDNDGNVFTITLNGFTSVTKINNNSNKKILDLTIPLGVSFAIIVIAIMVGVLVYLIMKRKKLAKTSANLKELREARGNTRK